MSDAYRVHRVIATNDKPSGYEEFDNVDFVLTHDGRSMVLGSLRLEGEVEVLVDGTKTLNETTNGADPAIPVKEYTVMLDGDVGAHSFIESVNTRVGGMVAENLSEYGRYCKMSAVVMTSANDNNNSSNVCELKAPKSLNTRNLLKGIVPTATGSVANPIRKNPDFSIKPRICLNGGQGLVPYRRSGDIRVSFNLARNFAALQGINMSSRVAYKLKNLRITYATVPDDGSNEPVAVKTKIAVKQSIQSSLANINVRVPNVCDAVSCSFNVQSQENAPKYNNYALHQVPNLTRTVFMFNNTSNSLVSYEIKSTPELTDRAIDSFVDAEKNNLSPVRLANNEGQIIGLRFDENIDLSKNAFTLQLDSAVSNLVPLIIYLYFHSTIEL